MIIAKCRLTIVCLFPWRFLFLEVMITRSTYTLLTEVSTSSIRSNTTNSTISSMFQKKKGDRRVSEDRGYAILAPSGDIFKQNAERDTPKDYPGYPEFQQRLAILKCNARFANRKFLGGGMHLIRRFFFFCKIQEHLLMAF